MNAKKNYAVMGLHHGAWEATASAQNGINAVVEDVIATAIEAGAPLENNEPIIHMALMVRPRSH